MLYEVVVTDLMNWIIYLSLGINMFPKEKVNKTK